MATKKDNQVWVRWFFGANWGDLFPVLRDRIDVDIGQHLSFYGDEFWSDADIEIIDGNTVTNHPASDFTPPHRKAG